MPPQGPATEPNSADQKPPTQAEKDQETNETLDFEPKELSFENAKRMYTDAKKYVDTGFRFRWDNYFRVYQGERVDPSYFGTITVNNREAHTIIETLVANIAGGLPTFHFIPTTEEQNTDTSLINNCLDYYMNYNGMALKNQIWVRDMLLYGTGILHVAWREGKAYIENIPIRDFFVDPTSTDLVKTQSPARYAGFEYLATKDELEAIMIYDPKENKLVPKYDLTDVGDNPISNGDTLAMDKQFKDMFNGSTLDQSEAITRQVHMVLIYDLVSGKVVEIANQKKFAFYADTWLQRDKDEKQITVPVDGTNVTSTKKLDAIEPFLPFAILRDYIDSSLFYGEGEMSVIMGDSELLNDYEAMDADNTSYQNTPMYTIDPQFADMAPEIETIAGAVYPIPKGALSAMEIPQLGEGLEIKKKSIVERMRGGTAADEAVQGISQNQGRVTATEVSSQLQQAEGRFTTKIMNLGTGGYAQLASVIFKMMCIFLTPDQSIRMIGKQGISFETFDPWDWNGEYEPQVKLDSQIKQQKMEVGQKNNQLFQSLDASPGVFDPVAVARFKIQHIDPTFTDEEFNKMLLPPQPPKEPDARDYVQLDKLFVAAAQFPTTQQNILKLIGLPADPALDGAAHTAMITEASKQADLLDPHTDTSGKPLAGIAPHIAMTPPGPMGPPNMGSMGLGAAAGPVSVPAGHPFS